MLLFSIREVNHPTDNPKTCPTLAEKCGIVALAALVIDHLDNPNAGNFPHSMRRGLNCGTGKYYAETCTTWKGGELVPEWIGENWGTLEHWKAYTLNTGETIKTAYTTEAGAFFLVFENKETKARRVWTVCER